MSSSGGQEFKSKKQLAAEQLANAEGSHASEQQQDTAPQPPVKASLIEGIAPMRKPRVGPEFQAEIPPVLGGQAKSGQQQ